jgi:hypothetical protein
MMKRNLLSQGLGTFWQKTIRFLMFFKGMLDQDHP